MSALFILVPSLISSTSMMIIPSGALTIVLAYLIWKKRGTILDPPGTDLSGAEDKEDTEGTAK